MVADLGQVSAEHCARLSEGWHPRDVQHDELHDANVFVSGKRHCFFDWGDASVSHPFVSLLVTLRMVARARDVANGALRSCCGFA